jgi:hypothetical protein
MKKITTLLALSIFSIAVAPSFGSTTVGTPAEESPALDAMQAVKGTNCPPIRKQELNELATTGVITHKGSQWKVDPATADNVKALNVMDLKFNFDKTDEVRHGEKAVEEGNTCQYTMHVEPSDPIDYSEDQMTFKIVKQ